MNVLIKSATVIDSSSEFHNQTVDILIEKGVITNIATQLDNPKHYKTLSLPNLHVSQGWFDSSVSFGEPGYEERETIANGLKTAALSGFTAVALNANTNPVTDNKSSVNYLKAQAANSPVNLVVVGALTKQSKGEDLAEIFDMHTAGAKAFYDYQHPVANPNVLKIALQYASNFDGLVCSFPQESKISGQGVMNEDVTSTSLGLKGNPPLAEALQVARDLYLLEYTNGKLHIPCISTSESVKLIKAAKKQQLKVTCSVPIHNLYFTDEALHDFNTNFKLLPPLRNKTDLKALKKGLEDGTIDLVTSDHNPIDIEHKKVEFDHALFGTIGLESAFGALNTIFDTKTAVGLLTKGKSIYGITSNTIAIGETAELSLFNPEPKYQFETSHIYSSSRNSVFLNSELKGMVYGIYAKGQLLVK